ncbi:hypothetical protein CFP71_09920 [Amycolatopsis thailandensis]|uniref:Uncharacterized protein n=1 Tax=Amycolatopsis thailandensis TaxID=589330 RepID=A0A229SDR1_9PSEU|nr:hypothetical protein [Amycolatopsis thailandensis]OXM57043.1 hypothetical protein CFP71_09920 [Amycolatopsis thailandensis]
MGYDTRFWGTIAIDPPLNEHERAHFVEFAENGLSATVRKSHDTSATPPLDIAAEHNLPDSCCQWIPDDAGTTLEFDQGEKFYCASDWMVYLIDTFLRPCATLQQDLARRAPGYEFAPALEHFTFDHQCNGEIDAQGEDADDRWRLIVRDNIVSVQSGDVVFTQETLLNSRLRTKPSGSPDPAGAPRTNKPILRLIAVRSSGQLAAWSDRTSERLPDGRVPGRALPATLAGLLDGENLVIPQSTPIVRFDLAPPLAAHLLLKSGIDPDPDLPQRTLRQVDGISRRHTNDDGIQIQDLKTVSIDLFTEFAAQIGVPVQRTSR